MKFGLWPDGKELPDTEAPFSFGGDRAFASVDAEKLSQVLGLGLGDMCMEELGTIRKLQRYLERIQQEICRVTDRSPESVTPKKGGAVKWNTCQTILHGDAHAWNIFWDATTSNREHPVRFIDLTNCGSGRVAWEVHYFISTSCDHDCEWKDNEFLLSTYYDELVRLQPDATADGFTFRTFRREYYLVALLHAAHHLAHLVRTKKYHSGKKTKLLKRQSTVRDTVGGKARKQIGNITQQTDGLLTKASQIFEHAEKELFQEAR